MTTEKKATDYIGSEELASRLGLGTSCLNKWRNEGTGPKWVRLGGSVRYMVGDVEQWLKEQAEETEKVEQARRNAK